MKAKKFQLKSRVTKLAIKNSEKPIAKQLLQNKNRLRIVRSPSFSLPFFKNKKIEDSITVRGNSNYGIRDVLPLDQDKQVQFEAQDGKVYDRPQF